MRASRRTHGKYWPRTSGRRLVSSHFPWPRKEKRKERERERKKYASTIIGRKLKVINKFWSPVEEKDSEKKERFGKRGHTVWLHLSKFLRVSAGTFFLLAKFRQGMQQLRLNS